MIKNIVDIQNNKIIIKDGFFGIDSTNPRAKLQIGDGNSLSTNPILLQVADTLAVIDSKRVGIGKYPEEDLDVDGNIQIKEKITFYDTERDHDHEHGKLLYTDDGIGSKFEIFTRNASSGRNVEKKFTINNQGAFGIGTNPNFGTPGQILTSQGTDSVTWGDLRHVTWTPYVEPFGLSNIGGLVTMDNQKAYYSSFYTSSALRYDKILLYTTESTIDFTGHIGVAIFDSNNSAVGTNKLQEGILQYSNSLSSGQELSINFSNPVVLNSNSKYWLAIAIAIDSNSTGSLGIAKSSSVNTDNIHIRKESSTNFTTSGFSSVVSTTNSNLNFWYRLYNSQVSTFNDFTDLSTELSLFEVNGTDVVSRFTINNQGAFGIGTNPNFGTPGQILTSNGTNSVTWEDTINYTAGTGVTISPSNVISIGQDVSTTNLVTFKSLDLLKDYTGFPILPPVLNFSDSQNGGVLATIYMESDGTSGGRLLFSTKDGSLSNERLRINRYGAIGIGGANYGSGGQVLTSNGPGTAVSWASKIYGSYYLATDTNVNNSSSSTYYRVGGSSGYSVHDESGVSLSNSDGHRITVLVAGTYKIEGTIVAHIQDSQGSYPWEGRIMRIRSGSSNTEIAHTHTRFSDYHPDGITDSALTWIHSMDVQAMVPLNKNDSIQLELRQGGGQNVIYQGNSDGSECRINLFKVD